MAAQFKSSFIPKKTVRQGPANSNPQQGGPSNGYGQGANQPPNPPQYQPRNGGNQNGGNAKPKPKKPKRKGDTTQSVILGIGIFAFVVVGLIAAGLFGYQYILEDEIATSAEQLESAQNEIDREFVSQLQEVDAKFEQGQQLLDNHITMQPFFDQLEENTVRSIQYDSFLYNYSNDEHTVQMNGTAQNYASLALQIDRFEEQSQIFQQSDFSSVSRQEDGTVSFEVQAVINPQLFSLGSEGADSNVTEN